MLIIGERINSSREPIKRAIEARDKDFLINEARRQIEAGADVIDANCGTGIESELDDMSWLVKTLKDWNSKIRLSLDSPNPKVLEEALKIHGKGAFINSISGEKARYEKILPLVREFDCDCVALTMDERGLPFTAGHRFETATIIMEIVSRFGVSRERIYFDPLVRPVSTELTQGAEFLKALRLMKEVGLKTIGGISNISFGLPQRRIINNTFLAMAIGSGLDAAILDPLDKGVMQTILCAECCMGRDQFSVNYIQAFRDGRLAVT